MHQTIEKILLEYEPNSQNLLTVLKKISAIFGYINMEEAQKVADYFSLPLSQVFETASFYDAIKVKKSAEVVIKVCSGTNCVLQDSLSVIKEIENYLKIKAEDDFNPKIKLEKVSCFGRCGEGPIMMVNDKVYTGVTRNKIYEILAEWLG
jgi:NADH-quinone oxidoreductase subunit E